jgi:hypothetical protein
MDIYPHLPPPTEKAAGPRFSTRTMFLAVAIVAAALALFRGGGLFVIAYFAGLLLLLVAVAYVVSQLRTTWAEGLFFVTLAIVGIAALSTRHKVRHIVGNLLARTDPATGQLVPRDQADIDAALLFLSCLVLSVVLGTALGWGLSAVQDRN